MLTRRLVAGAIASLGWTALGLQLYLNLGRNIAYDLSSVGDVVTYLSFFTVLTNLLIASCRTLAACEPDEESFWNWPSVQTALGVYILVVAIVYAAVLEGLWIPQGLEYLTDRFFHALLPMLYIAYWLFFTPKGSLRFADQILWQTYPFVYFIYTLTRGAIIGAYPYPFLDVTRDGYEGVFLNSLMLLALFLTLGSTLILIDWLLSSNAPAGRIAGLTRSNTHIKS
jgi:hypothetical protein